METENGPAETDKRMRLRYAGTCRVCATALPARTEAIYERESKTVRCVSCPEPQPAPSAPTPPMPTVSSGEERLGGHLDSLAGDTLAVLHDRRIPKSRANIDHLVITTAGIWVVDAKRYRGRPDLRIEGGILRPRTETLMVGRRDCSALVEGVLKQVGLVRDVVGEQVPVRGVLCFVEADWPLIGGSFRTQDVEVLWPRRLGKLLAESEPSPGHPIDVINTTHALAEHFPPA